MVLALPVAAAAAAAGCLEPQGMWTKHATMLARSQTGSSSLLFFLSFSSVLFLLGLVRISRQMGTTWEFMLVDQKQTRTKPSQKNARAHGGQPRAPPGLLLSPPLWRVRCPLLVRLLFLLRTAPRARRTRCDRTKRCALLLPLPFWSHPRVGREGLNPASKMPWQKWWCNNCDYDDPPILGWPNIFFLGTVQPSNPTRRPARPTKNVAPPNRATLPLPAPPRPARLGMRLQSLLY